MQKKVQIVSDGSLDLPQEITDAHDIEVVPFYDFRIRYMKKIVAVVAGSCLYHIF